MIEYIRAFTPLQSIAAAAILAVVLGLAIYIVVRIRRKPKDKEMRRRLSVNLQGRLGDATITEVQDNTVFYTYTVGGVTYAASQDISQLLDLIPMDPDRLIGRPASLKYTPKNPANSIILCEDWSGLRS